MLSILIADDKPTARKGLEEMIDWTLEGIEVVCSARDGRETLAECRRLRPDILLTDIKMPFLSGLDIARELRRERMPTRTIIVSGYSDFEFARDAVGLQVEGYLLKPVKKEELLAIVRRVVLSIRRELRQREDLAELRKRYREHLPALRVSLLKELISPESRMLDTAELRRELRALELTLDPDAPTIAAVVQIDDYHALKNARAAEEGRILDLSLERMLRSGLGNAGVEILRSRENEIAVLLQGDDCVPLRLGARLESLQGECRELLGVDFSCGVGSPVPSLASIRQSYHEARQAIQHNLYTGGGAVICYDTLAMPREDAGSIARPALRADILRSVEVGDTTKVAELLPRFYESYRAGDPELLARIQADSAELLIDAARSLLATGQKVEGVDAASALRHVFAISSAHEVHRYVEEVLAAIGAHFSQRYAQQTKVIMERVKEYVRGHFSEDISMQDLAEAVFYSPNYISLVFSKGTGQTVKEHITDVRVEHAKQLLRTSGKMVFEVACECGYEPHYFSTVFRKATGMTPKEYRENPAGR